MKVITLGHTQISEDFLNYIVESQAKDIILSEFYDFQPGVSDGVLIALAAIRECYSYKTALEVIETESKKYLGDGQKEQFRLFNHIIKSGHTSTMEHTHFTFAVEGVSRALLAQLTRHRHLSFSVQSQRYNKFSSDSRSGGFDYVVPNTVETYAQVVTFNESMKAIQGMYDALIACGLPQEDARAVLPNAACVNLVVSGNLRAWLEFYKKRKPGAGGQFEITQFAEHIKNEIIKVEPWVLDYFEMEE